MTIAGTAENHKNMTPKVSVVVPVFNAAGFLSQCIESLLAQTERSCEFIFVNDGSRDESHEIIARYLQKDNRIKVIDQENQGVSVARNNGIAIAQGEFLSFVDADDTIAPDMLETLSKHAATNNADIVFSNFVYEQNAVRIAAKPPFAPGQYGSDFIKTQVLPFMLGNDSLNSAANKMFRRELIVSNKINFPIGQALGEDAIFNLRALGKANAIYIADYSGYFYREVSGSATRNIIEKDYFGTALNVYALDHKSVAALDLDDNLIGRQKDFRLIDQVVSLAGIYAKPHDSLTRHQRYQYVRAMISNNTVRQIVDSRWAELVNGQPKFRKFVLFCIKYRLMPLLWLAFTYSYHRNKK
jgi:glycosyltransferase involved in cell wall biosynthesis